VPGSSLEGDNQAGEIATWCVTRVWDNPCFGWGLRGVLTIGQMFLLVEEDPVKKELRRQQRELEEQKSLQKEREERMLKRIDELERIVSNKKETDDTVRTADSLRRGDDIAASPFDIVADLEGYDNMYASRNPIGREQRDAIDRGLRNDPGQSFNDAMPERVRESNAIVDQDSHYAALSRDEATEAADLEQFRILDWVAQQRRKKRRERTDARMIGANFSQRAQAELLEKFVVLDKVSAMGYERKVAILQMLCSMERLAGNMVDGIDELRGAPLLQEHLDELERLALEVRNEEEREDEGEASFVGVERGGILRSVGRVASSVGSVVNRVWSGLSAASEDYAAALRGEESVGGQMMSRFFNDETTTLTLRLSGDDVTAIRPDSDAVIATYATRREAFNRMVKHMRMVHEDLDTLVTVYNRAPTETVYSTVRLGDLPNVWADVGDKFAIITPMRTAVYRLESGSPPAKASTQDRSSTWQE